MEQPEDDLRTVSDFLATHGHDHAEIVYLDTRGHRDGQYMGVRPPSLPITEDGVWWYASIRLREGFDSPPHIDRRVFDAVNRLFSPSQQRSCCIRYWPKGGTYDVEIFDLYAGRTEYAGGGSAFSFTEAVAGAFAAEKAEIERLTLLDRMFAVVKGWSEDVFAFPKGEEPLDVIRGALSMAERIFTEDVDKDGEMRVALDLIRAGMRMVDRVFWEHADKDGQMRVALDMLRAGMRMVRKAREDGVPEPVETLFDLFDTLTVIGSDQTPEDGLNTGSSTTEPTMLPDLMTPDEVAEYLRVGRWYLESPEMNGPPVVRAGPLVRYRRADVERWLLDHVERAPTLPGDAPPLD